MSIHDLMISRCFQLAKLGRGKVSPNPLVGCVITHNDVIIGEGYHQQYGEAHAEVNAIASVKDQSLLKEATAYVNLEPCAHFGKTPPCADLLVEKKLKRVVISCVDSHSKVAGKGIDRLKAAGIEVITGVLEKEGRELNKRFFTFMEKMRPYILLKWAQSQDGFIAPNRLEGNKGIHWISSPQTQWLSHAWRAEEDAILVGANTVITDNPSLTVRAAKGNDPTRIVLDPEGRVDVNSKLFEGSVPTYYFSSQKREGLSNATQFIWSKKEGLSSLLKDLHAQGIQSLIVEGGAHTLQSFIDAKLWDEARIITGTSIFNEGLSAPHISAPNLEDYTFGSDRIQIKRNL